MKARVFIDGEHGTTGLQIRSRLEQRKDIELLSIPEAERRNAAIREDLLNSADIAILCLPESASREAVGMIEGNAAVRIIDTSVAFRTDERWTYGFPEMERGQADDIRSARLVANPGCFPTGVIGLVRPLRLAGILPSDFRLTVNAVSGYTGGGKQLIAQMEDSSREDAIHTNSFLYGLSLRHKHVPEMKVHNLLDRAPLFSPSVGRFPQGMIVQVPLFADEIGIDHSVETVHGALVEHYRGQEAVIVATLDETAALARVDAEEMTNTDKMKLYVFGTDDHINLVAVLDNLGKGASGAAVQNMDLMLSATSS